MIPYPDFERAVSRWKIRQSGGQVVAAADGAVSGAVVAEMPAPNAPSYDGPMEAEARTSAPEEVSASLLLPGERE